MWPKKLARWPSRMISALPKPCPKPARAKLCAASSNRSPRGRKSKATPPPSRTSTSSRAWPPMNPEPDSDTVTDPDPETDADPSLSLIRALLRETPLIDGHNDLPWQFRRYHKSVDEIDLARDTSALPTPLITDIPRLRVGGLGAQFWAVYVPAEEKGPLAV